MKFNFGDYVKDKTTDFKGTIVARIAYDTGCIQFAVQPRALNDGKIQHPSYIDEAHLELVTTASGEKPKEKKRRPGGPSRNRPRHDEDENSG